MRRMREPLALIQFRVICVICGSPRELCVDSFSALMYIQIVDPVPSQASIKLS
jgi:hypothetical protein